MYFVGNCYCWANIFKLYYGGEIKSVSNEPGNKFRHYVLITKSGQIFHFKRSFNILPPPLCHFFFVGKFEFRKKKKSKVYKIDKFSLSIEDKELARNLEYLKKIAQSGNKYFTHENLGAAYFGISRVIAQLLVASVIYIKYVIDGKEYDSITLDKAEDLQEVRYYFAKE